MVLVAPGVCRFAINAQLSGRAVVNILDVKIDTTGSIESREDAIEDQAGIILSNWQNEVGSGISLNVLFENVSWVDLDEEDGSTGAVNTGPSTVWPSTGAASGAVLPSNTSVLVQKLTSGGRSTRSGRMYIAGALEAITATNSSRIIEETALTAWQGRMDDFKAGVEQDGSGVLGYSSELVVVHTRPVSPSDPTREWVSTTVVSELTVDETLATQRRRLRG